MHLLSQVLNVDIGRRICALEPLTLGDCILEVIQEMTVVFEDESTPVPESQDDSVLQVMEQLASTADGLVGGISNGKCLFSTLHYVMMVCRVPRKMISFIFAVSY